MKGLLLLRRENLGIGGDFLPGVQLVMSGLRCGWEVQEVGWEPVLSTQGERGTVAMPARSRHCGQVRVMIPVETPLPFLPGAACSCRLCLHAPLRMGRL